MPLAPAAPRELIHNRQVECRGYRREDGLWDVEGHITDTKSYGLENHARGMIEPGEPIHEMWIRLTVDDHLVIQEVEAVTDHSPYPICPAITPNFQRLKGLSIRPGFLSKARQLLGGTEGCTHLVELLGPVATTAFQTIYPYRERQRREAASSSGRRPRLIDSCHAFDAGGPVVKVLWPEFSTGS
jgi:hypothetical protein